MLKVTLFVVAAVVVILAAILWRPAAASSGQPGLQTTPRVDLLRYMGSWYEIARLDHRFQKDCIGSSAEYTLRSDGEVDVLNRCVSGKDGSRREAKGRAWSVDPVTNSRLKVSFFWPFRGDYWIVELGENYEYSVVGSPDRKYLWVLAREPVMDETLYSGIVERLRRLGYPVDSLVRRPLEGKLKDAKNDIKGKVNHD